MKVRAIVNRSIRRREMLRGTLVGSLTLLLMLTLTVQTWAVVFTNSATITINDATTIGTGNPYPANIAVSGLSGTVTNVSVTLNNMSHTFPDDFDILLVGPGGQNLILMSDVGGSDDMTNRTITFDDDASASIADATTLLSGAFKPTNIGAGDTWPAPAPAPSANTTLGAAFNGTDPNGTWSLYVVDDLGVDVGVIGNGWSLMITTEMDAATFSNDAPIFGGDGARGRATPYASSIDVSGLTGAVTDVNVTFTNLNHANPDDLDIMLISPSGKRLILLSDAGGTTDVVNATLTFDDAAAAVVPDAGPLVTATVKPTNFGTGDTLPDLLPPYANSASAGTATLASVFNGTEPNGTWSLYVVDDATTSAGNIVGGWSIDITAGGTYGAKRFTSGDFDGDGKTDVSVFRSSDNNWYFRDSASYSNRAYVSFGEAGDAVVPADYDGDGKTDIAVFRPSTGNWYVVESATNTLRQEHWGMSGDVPVPADYDGDGSADLAVWREGIWYISQSTDSSVRVVSWGMSGDLPVRGHFEGTDAADFTVYRPSTNMWFILDNAEGAFRALQFGAEGDVLAPADYDGDGKTDVAVYRDSSGDFFILQSSTGNPLGAHWGVPGDVPVPGDYDADSRADMAVWRPSTNAWYIMNSGTPAGAAAIRSDNWGLPGDTPLPYTYLPQQ